MKKYTVLLLTCLVAIIFITLSVPGSETSEIPFSETGELEISDYDIIEIDPEDVLVTDETVMSYLDLMAEDLADTDDEGNTSLPELTDEFITANSLIYFGIQLNSIDEAKAYIRSTLEDQNLKNAVIMQLMNMARVISYPEETYNMVREYTADEISFYAYQEGIDEDTMAILSGYGSADDYILIQTNNNVKTSMIIDRILDELEIEWSEDDRNESVNEYMHSLGYDALIDVDDFIENAGETWLWLFTEFQYKSGLMFEALESHIQMTE